VEEKDVGHIVLGHGIAVSLLGDDSVNTLADEDDIHDLQVPEFRFGGDIFLKPRAERFTQLISD
jgi:hypothetical protein